VNWKDFFAFKFIRWGIKNFLNPLGLTLIWWWSITNHLGDLSCQNWSIFQVIQKFSFRKIQNYFNNKRAFHPDQSCTILCTKELDTLCTIDFLNQMFIYIIYCICLTSPWFVEMKRKDKSSRRWEEREELVL
jgi:hypothetical protein